MSKKYNVDVKSISCNYLNLYDSSNINNNLDEKIEEIYNKLSKVKLHESKRFLVLDILGSKENKRTKMPKIKYIFNNVK